MKTVEMAQATGSLTDYVAQAASGPLIVTANGKPIAALVAIPNGDRETVSLSTNAGFLDIIERSRACQDAEGGISSDEMRRRLGVKSATG